MNQTLSEKGRVIFLDWLRIIAALSVVMIHVSVGLLANQTYLSSGWIVCCTFDALLRWNIPAFLMISGAMMLDRDRSVSAIYRKNILRIFIVLVFWSFVYAAVDCLKGMSIRDAIPRFLAGHYHLWYLYTIIGLYMITPLLKKITDHPDLERYFLVLAFVFAIVIDHAIKIGNVYSPESAVFVKNEILSNAGVYFPMGYVGYYVLGHYLFHHPIRGKKEIAVYILGVFGLISTVVFSVVISGRGDYFDATFMEQNSVNILLESVAVFVFFQNHVNHSTNAMTSTILSLSNYTLGIYLIHLLILENMSMVYGIEHRLPPLLSVPVVTIVVAALSFAATWVLSKIPIMKKMI